MTIFKKDILQCIIAAAVVLPAGAEDSGLEILVIGDPGESAQERFEAVGGSGSMRFAIVTDLANWDSAGIEKIDAIVVTAGAQAFENVQDRDLRKFVQGGGGLILLGGAGDCFFKEANYSALVGASFSSYSGKVELYRVVNTGAEHPVTTGVGPIEGEGARIGHENFQKNCTVLQTRDGKPWTWVRQVGRGKVIYAAFTNEEKTWQDSEFRKLLRNAIQWAAKAKR